MPGRIREKRVASTAVQGADSHVTVRAMTQHEARAIQAELDAILAELPDEADEEARRANKERQNRRANELFAQHVIDWNWVDDEGLPLPKPHNNPDAMEALTTFETLFIRNALFGDNAEKKR